MGPLSALFAAAINGPQIVAAHSKSITLPGRDFETTFSQCTCVCDASRMHKLKGTCFIKCFQDVKGREEKAKIC